MWLYIYIYCTGFGITLPETNIFAPENGGLLKDDPFLLGFGLFKGAFAVSSQEGIRVFYFLLLAYSFKHWKHRGFLGLLLLNVHEKNTRPRSRLRELQMGLVALQ